MITLLGDAKVLDRGEVLRLADRAGTAQTFNGKSKWTLRGHLLGAFTVAILSDGKKEYVGVAKRSMEDTERDRPHIGLEIAIRRAFDAVFNKATHPGQKDYRHKHQNGHEGKANMVVTHTPSSWLFGSELDKIERGAA